MQHLDEGTVHAWLDNALPDAERAHVERHVAECSSCAAMAAEARGLIAGASRIVASLDVVRGGVIPKHRPATAARTGSLWSALRVTPLRAALAASLLISAATLLSLRHDTPDKLVPTRSAVASAPSPSPATATPPVSTAAPTAAAVKDIPPRRRIAEAVKPAVPAAASAPVMTAAAATDTAVVSRVAAAPPSSALADAGELRAKVAEAARDSAQSLAMTSQRKGFSPVMQLRNLAGIAPAARGFVGCYRLPTDTSAWLRFVPERFALEQSNGTAGSTNVVRAVAADGRIDSVVAGSTWLQIAPQVAHVNFALADRKETVALQLASSGLVTARLAVGGTHPVSVVHTECRP